MFLTVKRVDFQIPEKKNELSSEIQVWDLVPSSGEKMDDSTGS